ncbi:DUF1758 domain-containing protein [Trichonephila clavipes]|nr:DUF1758 domain-containing protein [Trichonephila clavipes]
MRRRPITRKKVRLKSRISDIDSQKYLKNVSSGGEKRSFPDNPEVVNKSHSGGECSWSVPPQAESVKESVFGYIVGGSVEDELNLYSCGLICGSEELNSSLRKFWEIEEKDNELPKNLENSICEEHYAQTHKRDESGKYIVSIPFKEHWSCLGNSKDIALKRLESLWIRLSRDQDYQKLYRDFLKEYEELGHMTKIKESVEPEYTYYMPHHGIYRPQKSTTKLRTVFNASALTANGKSLNSIQYNGGIIQDDLFSLLVRFRKHIYAFTADIRQMYRMIDVDVSQRPLQRILWKGDVNEPVKVYQLNTVTYGTASAPFLAMRTQTNFY